MRFCSAKWRRQPCFVCLLLGLLSSIAIVVLQLFGGLQGFELRAFDRHLLLRPSLPIDDRIVLIDETEADIHRFGHPLPDQILADALLAVEKAGARVIGVDKYRDVSVEPGTEALNRVLQQHGNIVWIFFAGNTPREHISAPSVLVDNPERAGFNDLIEDPDGVSRRGLLFMDLNGNSFYAFPLLLSLHYLSRENIARLEADLAFVKRANVGAEFMSEQDQARIHAIAEQVWCMGGGQNMSLLSDDEVYNLCVARGNLTKEERDVINHHVVATIDMLKTIDFPKHLKNVPEFAGGHHERMDGKGYPRGLRREQMSVQARIMGIADIFEALMDSGRPYKKAQKLSEALAILKNMKENGHVDPDLYDVFIQKKVYKQYAEQYLPAEQIDVE